MSELTGAIARRSRDVVDRRLTSTCRPSSGASGTYYSLPHLEKKGVASISRLPVSIRILLESVLRHRRELWSHGSTT
jgi:aconitase A